MAEIDERRAFLEDMRSKGTVGKYDRQIQAEIHQVGCMSPLMQPLELQAVLVSSQVLPCLRRGLDPPGCRQRVADLKKIDSMIGAEKGKAGAEQ